MAASLLIASVAVLFIVVASPLALGLIAPRSDNWVTLSNVGQAYGAVSALLSALALFGVMVSLAFQWRQNQIALNLAVREQQRALVEMGISNPELLYSKIRDVEEKDLPMTQYANLWMSHWKLLWDMRNIHEPHVSHLAYELFKNDVAYAWWEKVGTHWNIDGSRRDRKFMEVVMEAHREASEHQR
ncbi:DUF6082 family protein [Phytohabitans houttuyneae]|uniref:DUF6082 family protein n=1 Tax=Phytohabitans houttuyneae TaxID=1076126 RepID=UPI0015647899|nr:DUF6082 family protein [Phytohabitans houttuyneae]